MRIYVLITKARPLTVHLYREGIARFSSDRYDTKSLKNVFSHLTNTSINKNAPNANIMSGGTFGQGIKWTFDQLKSLFRVIIIPVMIFNIGPRFELGKAMGKN
jgi:tubulin polyglutamylase TTLL2